MANFPRVLMQVMMTGTQIVGRAFMDAYRIAAENSAKNAAQAAASRSADALTRRTGMEVDEAIQILHIQTAKEEMKLDDIVKRYEHLFKVNEEATGGSFYLQSKVVRARERLELELNQRIEKLKQQEPEQQK